MAADRSLAVGWDAVLPCGTSGRVMGTENVVEPRATVRAIVLDRSDHVLLQAIVDPTVFGPTGRPHDEPAWIAPGGGLVGAEDPETGLLREWIEETGLRDVTWGPWLWRRDVTLNFQGRLRAFQERYRLGRLDAILPSVRPTALDDYERSTLRGYAWWTVDELRATRSPVYPPRLATLLDGLLRNGPPAEPLDISPDG